MSKKRKHEWTEEDDAAFMESFDAWARKADKKYDTVDWEKLCGQLQEALAKEMKENEKLDEDLAQAQLEVIQASGIIKYLEARIADCMDMIDEYKSI
jgi:hypothetical protein